MNRLSVKRSPTNRGNRRLFSGVLGHKHKAAQLLGTAFTLVILAILLMPVKPSYAVPPGSNERIAFQNDDDWGGWDVDIYTMNADGSNATNLTNNNAENYSPTWSPVSSKIAFARWGGSTYDIYVMNSDGSGQTKLFGKSDSDEYDPAWSPDGSKIAFAQWGAWDSGIYAMNADGSNLINVIESNADSYGPAWSPDGQKIIFAQWGDSSYDIYVKNADGTGDSTNLTNNNADSLEPAWYPLDNSDSDQFVFTQWGAWGSDIYVMNTDGNNPTNLTDNSEGSYGPAWSPDGSKIAFAQWGGDWYSDIYVMNASGTMQTKLSSTGDSDDSDPAWSPDGSKIAFVRSRYADEDYSDAWPYYRPAPLPPPVRTKLTRDTTPPVITSLNITYKFAPSSKKTAVRATVSKKKVKKGATISYTLSEAALVKLAMQKKLKGLKLKKKVKGKTKKQCVTNSKKNRKKLTRQIKSKYKKKKLSKKKLKSEIRKASCTLYKNKGTLTRSGTKGVNKVPFSGRIGKRKLSRGSYRLVATATDSGGNVSKPKSKSFKIVKSKKKKAKKKQK